MDIFAAIMNFWGAGELAPVGTSKKLFTREIAGKVYQFRVLDYRTRFKMGGEAVKRMAKFSELVQVAGQIAAAKEAGTLNKMTETQIAGVVVNAITKGMEENDDVFDYILNLASAANVQKDGKFSSLAEDQVAAEYAFGSDLIAILPVALSVIEVNCAEGFFGKLESHLASVKLTTDE